MKRMLCCVFVAAMFWMGAAIAQEGSASTADRHKKRDITCNACHGEEQPKTPALAEACLTCHNSLEAVAEKTKDFDKNPHKNHLTESSDLECTQCHHGHKADTPICHQCHEGMKFEKLETIY